MTRDEQIKFIEEGPERHKRRVKRLLDDPVIQSIIHAADQEPEAKFNNFEDLMRWLDE